MPKHIGSFQKRSAPLPRRKWKMTPSPSLRTSQDSRTSPLPRQQSPKLYPPDIGYFKRFNKSRQTVTIEPPELL